jgi:hypothetical protein
LKASLARWDQTKWSIFFINWYSGMAFSPSQLTNRLNKAKHLANFCTSLSWVGSSRALMAFIFEELAFIPHWETI